MRILGVYRSVKHTSYAYQLYAIWRAAAASGTTDLVYGSTPCPVGLTVELAHMPRSTKVFTTG
jgi:hypothetical protein